MIRRTTWILLGLFGLVVAVAWYLQSSQQQRAAQATETHGISLLFPLQEVSITALRIIDQHGHVVEVKRESEGEWVFLGLEDGEPDIARIERAVSNASGIRVLSSLESQPELALIGLENPAYRIVIILEGGQQMEAFIGDLTALGNGYYARVASEDVVVANKFNLDAIIDLLAEPPVLPAAELMSEPEIEQTEESK
ncbi:MAG: hypothetical protein IBX69_14970 [Anaerolineales bacterium]|nr:hypothetical protein [Anaerolineales bacterium]